MAFRTLFEYVRKTKKTYALKERYQEWFNLTKEIGQEKIKEAKKEMEAFYQIVEEKKHLAIGKKKF